jgi:hypothetical protein
MDQSRDIVRFLEEIRDLQPDHLAECRRFCQEVVERNRLAAESSKGRTPRPVRVEG